MLRLISTILHYNVNNSFKITGQICNQIS